jgi:AraC-like DNA-binding protein
MLTEELDAASAAFEVGYESPSQFNREYKRFFGQPPMRDYTSIASQLVIAKSSGRRPGAASLRPDSYQQVGKGPAIRQEISPMTSGQITG